MSLKNTYTITAALPYANGKIHIGHLAGAYLPADVFARHRRKQGHDVAFICGSDEGGVAILLRARAEGKTPQEIIDHYHTCNKAAFKALGIHFDIFSRTSSALHAQVASDFFLHLHKKGIFEQKESDQLYDPKEEMFLADRYVQGTCPHCHFEEAYGDQCESCGTSLSPEELIHPRSKLTGAVPIKKKTTHWYFPLDQDHSWLSQWILEEHKEWKNNVYGQCKSWLQQGLHSRAITRDLPWGIPVPLPNAENKVLYVWFEAPIGYISATQEWAASTGKDWRRYWQDPNTHLIHFVGKDNIVFHCVIFPAMLKAHGDYILPENVPANEFMNLEGAKISTSRNHAIWLEDFLAENPGKEDVLRYVLLANAPESKDSNFRWQDYEERYTQDLIGILSNFVYRTTVLLKKQSNSQVPKPNELQEKDHAVLAQLQELSQSTAKYIETYKMRKALATMIDMARLGNKYLADEEPWKIHKKNPVRAATVLYISVQVLATLAIWMEPFMPFTAEKMYHYLDIPSGAYPNSEQATPLPIGHVLPSEPLMLFQREK